jgi:hypothetical protein
VAKKAPETKVASAAAVPIAVAPKEKPVKKAAKAKKPAAVKKAGKKK